MPRIHHDSYPVLLETTVSHEFENRLNKRDLCADTFGSNWSTNTCAPGHTLCCVNSNQTYPQCQNYLGKGFCCVAYQEECYIDLPVESSCDAPAAISCTQLANGVSSACCPQHTTCAPGVQGTSKTVRCNIEQKVLASLVSSSSTVATTLAQTSLPSSSTSTSAFSSNTTSTVTSTSSASMTSASNAAVVASPTSQVIVTSASAEPTTSTFTTSELAGIAIGPSIAVAVMFVGAWIWYQKSARNRKPRSRTDSPYIEHRSSFPKDTWRATPERYYPHKGNVGFVSQQSATREEVPSPKELYAGERMKRYLAELDGGQ